MKQYLLFFALLFCLAQPSLAMEECNEDEDCNEDIATLIFLEIPLRDHKNFALVCTKWAAIEKSISAKKNEFLKRFGKYFYDLCCIDPLFENWKTTIANFPPDKKISRIINIQHAQDLLDNKDEILPSLLQYFASSFVEQANALGVVSKKDFIIFLNIFDLMHQTCMHATELACNKVASEIIKNLGVDDGNIPASGFLQQGEKVNTILEAILFIVIDGTLINKIKDHAAEACSKAILAPLRSLFENEEERENLAIAIKVNACHLSQLYIYALALSDTTLKNEFAESYKRAQKHYSKKSFNPSKNYLMAQYKKWSNKIEEQHIDNRHLKVFQIIFETLFKHIKD